MALILVVDDEILVCNFVSSVLRSDGYEVMCVTDIAAAEAQLERHVFDGLICDVNLAHGNGTILLEHRRVTEAHSAVVVMSGQARLPVAMDAMHRGANDFLVKPFSTDELLRSLREALARRSRQQQELQRQRDLELLVADRTVELTETVSKLHRAYDMTIEALGAAIDLKDSETLRHCKSVAELSLQIATRYGLSDQEQLRDLRWGALLHDLGKIGIPESILHKPGRLTEQEWIVVRTHPELGARLLSGIEFLRRAAEVVLYHHERYDGSGYPAGLAGEQIPLAARIFAIADTVDVLHHGRVYRDAVSWDGIRAEVKRCAGSHFDPRVVEALLALNLDTTGVLA